MLDFDTKIKTDVEPLFFPESYIALLYTFNIIIPHEKDFGEIRHNLRKRGLKVSSDDRHSTDFKIVEDFLFPLQINQERLRFKIDDLVISCPNYDESCLLGEPICGELFFVIYQKLQMGVLILNLKLNRSSVDDLIFLRQSLFNRNVFNVVSALLSSGQNNKLSIKQVFEKYAERVSLCFSYDVDKKNVVFSSLIEIRQVKNFNLSDPDNLIDLFPIQVYGLLTSDEGWRFVPEKIARNRVNKRWRTRDFLTVISLDNSVLVVNLSNSKRYLDYAESQKSLRITYGYEAEDYFKLNPQIAGLNHGPLLSLEICSVMRLLLDIYLQPGRQSYPKEIKDFIKERKKILDILTKLSAIDIREIGYMEQMIRKSLQIEKDVQFLNEKLEILERSLLIEYNKKINFKLILMSFLGLIVAVIGILSGIMK